jgi:hypothetical protein
MAAGRRRQQNSDSQKKNAITRAGKTFDLQTELSSEIEPLPAFQDKSFLSRCDRIRPVRDRYRPEPAGVRASAGVTVTGGG